MHPAVLAKYSPPYRPYVFWDAGAASLNQYFGMQQILPEIEEKQAVFVISPQWFTEEDYEPAFFKNYFNNDQLTAFLENQSGDIGAKHAAKRLLKQNPGVSTKGIVEKLSKGEELSRSTMLLSRLLHVLMSVRLRYLDNFPFEETQVQGTCGELFKDLRINFLWGVRKIARKDAEAIPIITIWELKINFIRPRWKTTSRSIGLSKKLQFPQVVWIQWFAAGSQSICQIKGQCPFLWSSLSKKNGWPIQGSARKCTNMLLKNSLPVRKSGFHPTLLTFLKKVEIPTLSRIRFTLVGLASFDKVVNPFLTDPTPAPDYKMNDRFFSKDWATYDGKIKDFQ